MADKDKNLFVFIGTYPDEASAQADYDVVKALHGLDAIGGFDAAVVTKDPDGKVHVNKDETPTRKGALGGIAVGAVVGILFPPAIIGSAASRASRAASAVTSGRACRARTSRSSASVIDEGEAALPSSSASPGSRSDREGRAPGREAGREADRRRRRGAQAAGRGGGEGPLTGGPVPARRRDQSGGARHLGELRVAPGRCPGRRSSTASASSGASSITKDRTAGNSGHSSRGAAGMSPSPFPRLATCGGLTERAARGSATTCGGVALPARPRARRET